MNHAIAAYPETRSDLADMIREITIDISAFARPLLRCDLGRCGGACCHDGVYLSAEEARVIREGVEAERSFFQNLGLDLPERVVVYGKWRDQISGPKTATREESGIRRDDFADHFPSTSCVFLLSDARCAWQVLSLTRGDHPWAMKPLTCWLHPLSIASDGAGGYRLTLHSEKTDPQQFPDYEGFVSQTGCGKTHLEGAPAWQILSEELRVLGELGDRDLVGEIESELAGRH